MKKRFLSILLTLCMVFTLFSQTAYSEEAEEVPVCNCTILCTPVPECICPPADNSELVHGEDCPLSNPDTAADFARIMDSNEIFDCVSGDLIGNKARSDMPVLGKLVTDGAADNINGADIIVGVNTEQSSAFDLDAFSEANGWNPVTGKPEMSVRFMWMKTVRHIGLQTRPTTIRQRFCALPPATSLPTT